MDSRLGDDPLAPTELASPVRNHYYYGKLLDVPHLELEQRYLNAKRWLLNRLLAGTGVVCGLKLSPAMDGTRIVIDPGVAIDAWGREIVVPALSAPIDPRALTDDDGRPAGTIDGAGSITIAICYHECGVDPAPVMIASCRPEGDCASSAIREQYTVIVKPGTAVPPPSTCKFPNLFEPADGESEPVDLQTLLVERAGGPCVVPEGQGCVLLGQVNLPADGAITPEMIDHRGRAVAVSQQTLVDLIVCLIGQVQQLTPGGSTPRPTAAPTPTRVPSPTLAPEPTRAPTPTLAPEPTRAPTEPTRAPTPTLAPVPTRVPTPTLAPDPTRGPTPTLAPVPTRVPTPTRAPTPGARPVLRPKPTPPPSVRPTGRPRRPR